MIARRFSVTNHIVGASAIVLCTIVGCLNAGWWRTYGEGVAYSVEVIEGGGYIFTGKWSVLIRVDKSGGIIWKKDYVWHGSCIRSTNEGGFIIVSQPNKLIKMDSLGDTLWTRSCNWELSRVEQTSEGGYIVTGYFVTDEWMPYIEVVLCKVDNEGTTLWSRHYGGYYNADLGYCVKQTSDGGYIISGDREGKPLLIKTDSEGILEWEHDCEEYGLGLGPAYYVQETYDGGYVFVGAGGGGGYLIKTDSLGDMIVKRQYEGGSFSSVQQTPDSGYIIVGTKAYPEGLQDSDLWLLKTNSSGDTLWTRAYGSDKYEYGCDLKQTNDGGYIMCGGNDHCSDVYLIKTDSLGLLGVEEPEAPVTNQPDWQITQPIGRTITLRTPEGSTSLNLAVFDASGRKVDELILDGSATITWGECYGPGVYFIRQSSGKAPLTHKVILVK